MSEPDLGSTSVPSSSPVVSVGPYEVWMLAQTAIGFLAVGGMMFLIPAFVLDQGGSPADAGAVMALAGAIALAGPAIGNFADRFGAHRVIQLGSIVMLGVAAVSFAFAEQELLWLVAAACLGLGMAGLSVINATLVVGAGFDGVTQAQKLSLLQLSLPSGQVLGLAAVAALSAADVDFRGRFLVIGGISLLFLLIVATTAGGAITRMQSTTAALAAGPEVDVAEDQPQVGLRQIVMSQFGITLGLIALITLASQAIESQYPNYMKDVFDIDPSASAGALSVIVLVSIPLYLVAGKWTAAAGPRIPFIFSAAARAAAGLGLLLLPKDAGTLALVVFGVIMVVYPMFELNAATLAAVNSPIGAGAGQGAMGAAMAFGTIVASVLGGWIAGQIGFSSLATITLIAAGAATVIGVLFLNSPDTEPS